MDRSAVLRQWQEKVDELEDQHRKKVMEKDSRIRTL
jgi:chromosome segregation ATPase